MTKEEISLLLFLETCAVDRAGKINIAHCNDPDFAIMKEWNDSKYILSGRVCSRNCNQYGTYWCQLSDKAWTEAHQERKNRADRMWKDRNWKTAEETNK